MRGPYEVHFYLLNIECCNLYKLFSRIFVSINEKAQIMIHHGIICMMNSYKNFVCIAHTDITVLLQHLYKYIMLQFLMRKV